MAEIAEILNTILPSISYTAFAANDKLMEQGNVPISLSLVGTPGLGKTTICRELAKDLNRDFYKLNLAQLTEPSELIGYYSKEYEVVKNNEVRWVTENLLPKATDAGFKYTNKTRTVPCPPDWIVNLKDNGILLLDDYSRSNTLFSQAIMELSN